MSFDPAISTSKSTLMHASLAYLTDEIRTLDDIIHNPSTSRKRVLPTELLFLIRGLLFPAMTAQLIKQSTIALEAYEQSLCELLCSDCVAYNVDIYGPDIWQWEQFSCACTPAGNEDPHGHRSARINGRQRQEHYRYEPITNSKATPDVNALKNKQFADADDWLESYLFGKAARKLLCIGRRGNAHSLAGTSGSGTRSLTLVDIWDVVGLVLREVNCEAVQLPSDRGQSCTIHDTVQVIPLRHHMPSDMERLCSEAEPETRQEDTDWRAQVTLHLAVRDLGLLLEYPEAIGFNTTGSRRQFVIPTFTRRLCWPSVSHSYYTRSDDTFQILLRVLASLAGACLSLPVTCATIVVTVFCFYSKRGSLRIF